LFWASLIGFVAPARAFALQSKNAMLSTFLFLDQIVWAGRTGIYKVLREITFVEADAGFTPRR
jgi:hypothetical protein